MSALADVLAFLLDHVNLIGAIQRALTSGTSKEDILKAIEQSAIATSDADMRIELGDK